MRHFMIIVVVITHHRCKRVRPNGRGQKLVNSEEPFEIQEQVWKMWVEVTNEKIKNTSRPCVVVILTPPLLTCVMEDRTEQRARLPLLSSPSCDSAILSEFWN